MSKIYRDKYAIIVLSFIVYSIYILKLYLTSTISIFSYRKKYWKMFCRCTTTKTYLYKNFIQNILVLSKIKCKYNLKLVVCDETLKYTFLI